MLPFTLKNIYSEVKYKVTEKLKAMKLLSLEFIDTNSLKNVCEKETIIPTLLTYCYNAKSIYPKALRISASKF